MGPTTTHSESDSEDDPDYVPPADDSDSADERDRGDKSNATEKPSQPETDLSEQKKRRDALWASFQASVTAQPSTESGHGEGSRPPPVVRQVKIEKTYLFAGKHVTEVVQVPEDSEEAKKWPRWSPPEQAARPMGTTATSQPESESTSISTVTVSPRRSPPAGDEEGAKLGESDRPVPCPPSQPPTTTENAATTSGAKRPGPRKSRTMLPSIPPKGSQARKITTLDKSAMDWRAHVSTQSGDVRDELDVNRRGGGYLEKVDFLKRVQDRRDDAFEASKSSKRRKA